MKMNATPILGLVLLFVTLSFADSTDFNKVFDDFLRKTLSQNKASLDPLEIPEQRLAFDKKVGPINITAEARLYDIKLYGVETLRRTGEASLEKMDNSDHELHLNLALGIMDYECKSKMAFMGFGPKMHYKGRVVHADVDMVMLIDSINNETTLKEVKINELVGLTLKVDGPGFIVDAISNRIISLAINNLRRTMKFALQKALTPVLGKALVGTTFLQELIKQ